MQPTAHPSPRQGGVETAGGAAHLCVRVDVEEVGVGAGVEFGV